MLDSTVNSSCPTLEPTSQEETADNDLLQRLATSNWRAAQKLHALWESKIFNDALPKRSDFHLSDMTSFLGMLMITEQSPDNDQLVVRLMGTGLCQLLGQNLTHKNLCDQPEFVHVVPYVRQTIQDQTPLYEEIIPLYIDQKTDLYCKIYSCPIQNNDGTNILSLAILKSFETSIIQP